MRPSSRVSSQIGKILARSPAPCDPSISAFLCPFLPPKIERCTIRGATLTFFREIDQLSASVAQSISNMLKDRQ